MSGKRPKVGLITATSLVVGNMIGAGIYVLPAALASYGSISILAWVISALGGILLALIFKNFSKILAAKSGGPYAYSKAGFGDFIGFVVAWGYWISVWVGNAAIGIAAVGALSFYFPILNESVPALVCGLSLVWFFYLINVMGLKTSGKVQVVTTFLKVIPLLLVIFAGLFFFQLDNFPAFNLTGEGDWKILALVMTLTLYAFLGVESATIPAANIRNAKKTVPRATMLGTFLTTAIYILGTVILFGMIPSTELQSSPTPFADAAEILGGIKAGNFVAFGAAISALGALNGWTLISAQIPMAAAEDGLFPKIFKRKNKRDSPHLGLFVGASLTSLVMLMNYSESLVDQFELIILLSSFTALVPYLFTAASYVLVLIDKGLAAKGVFAQVALALLTFIYILWAIYGAGNDTVFYGFLMLMAGIPFYVYMKFDKKRK